MAFEPVQLPHPAVRLERWSWPLVTGSALMGALGAFAAALVRLGFRSLQWLLTGSAADLPLAAMHLAPWRRLLTPALGAALALLVLWAQRRQDRAHKRQPEHYVEYVEAVRHRSGLIPLAPNGWRTLSAAFSVASGAAVGREGSMIQFASAIASTAGRLSPAFADAAVPLGFLVACGVAGGVTAAYSAPGAAVFFAAEIVLGGLAWRELFLLTLAASAGYLISGLMLGWERLYPTPVLLHFDWRLTLLLPLAVLLGAAGPAYQWLLGSLKAARRLPLALLGSALIVGTASLLDTRVWGNGDAALRGALGIAGRNETAAALIQVLLLRSTATLACVWTGTVGGVFTPTLFTGAALGALGCQLLLHGSGCTVYAVAGMGLFLAATTHAPLMATAMTIELTGTWELVPLVLPLNLLATWIARHISPTALYAIASQTPDVSASLGDGLKQRTLARTEASK